MLRVALLSVCVLSVLCASLSDRAGDGGNCTNGFMSRDRMDKVVGNMGGLVVASNLQGIFPEVGFTCSGRIHAWVFGAKWTRSSASEFTELQIWRLAGDGLYTKVENTTIMTQSNSSQIYYYMLPAPLDFQAGDVLGYHQPDPLQDQLKLYYEPNEDRVGQTGYFYRDSGPANELYIPEGVKSDEDEILVNVITDAPDCLSGFMGLERIRLLLNVDRVSSTTNIERRQQISPEMNFTCNGTITKWIIGADSFFGTNRHLYPELQVWRNIVNDTYVKISGTNIFFPFAKLENRIYEYSGFTPIEVKAGDILGVFTPDYSYSRIFLLSEGGSNRPAQYYHSLSGRTLSSSNIDVIDIEKNVPLLTRRTTYYPVVSVEFVRSSTTSVTIPLSSTSITVATHTSTAPLPSSEPSPPSITESSSQSAAVAAGVGAGIAVFLVLIILVVLVVILVMILLLRDRPKSKPAVEKNADNAVDNPVYTGTTSQSIPMGPLGEIYEVPQEREGEGIYDLAQNGGETSPSAAYSKFDNILYETN